MGHALCLPTQLIAPRAHAFFYVKAMSRPTFINSTVVYNDHSTEYNIDARGNKDIASVVRACKAEDVTPEPSSVSPEFNSGSSTSEKPDSIIFTKKAKKEAKEATILDALQKSVQGRKDKTRAFVEELHGWQKEGYIDAHYNAQVMYDELDQLTPLSFGYEVFKKHYNNTRV